MKRILAVATLAALLHTGCSSNPPPTCKANGDRADGCDEVMCSAAGGPVFPTFDKTCTRSTDCAIGVHQINCCGSTIAIGMSAAAYDLFAASEQLCVEQYPACACPAFPTVAEDGQSESAGRTIAVECRSNQCTTVVR